MNNTQKINFIKTISYFDDRFYKVEVDGFEQYYPSVTTILGITHKPWLAQWRGQVGNWEADRVTEEALHKGSVIHSAIEIILAGGKVIFNPAKSPVYTQEELEVMTQEFKCPWMVLTDQQQHLEVWRLLKWVKTVRPKVIYSEHKVASAKHQYAGTIDGVFDIEEGSYSISGSKALTIPAGRYIVDYKTGKNFDDDYYLQASAYMKALEEGSGENEIAGALIIHTNDNKIKGGIEGLKTYLRNREELETDFQDFLACKKLFDRKSTVKPKIIDLPGILSLEEELQEAV